MKKSYLSVLFIAIFPLILNCGGGSNSSGSQPPRYSGTNNEITAYSFTGTKNPFLGQNNFIDGKIEADSITLEVKYGTSVSSLTAEFVTNSKEVKVNGTDQKSGTTVNDFTNPVIYSVSADDGTKRDYTVIVTVAKNTEKKIASYSINAVTGTIIEGDNSGTINVVLPPHSAVMTLKAVFSAIGKSVHANNTVQLSGVTLNDFTNPIEYTVAADNGSIRKYTVIVSVTKDTQKDITNFAFMKADNPSLSVDVTGTINGTDIQCVLPFGSNPADLVASYVTTGASAAVEPISGVPDNDYTTSRTFHVTAEDGSAKDYNVTATVAKSDSKAITSFSIDGETGTIDEQAQTITVQFAASKNLSNLIASFVTTGVSVKVNGTDQTSGATVNDFSGPLTYRITADNGTTRDYAVNAVKSGEITGLWNFEYGSDGSTVHGTTEIPGVTGNALQFDGLTDYVLTPDSDALTLANGGSIEVVLNAITHRPFAGIVHKGVLNDFSDETYSLQFWGAGGTDGTVRFLVHNTTQDADHFTFVDSGTKLNTGTWYHLIATWDNSHLALYINGSKDASIETDIGEVKDSAGGLVIGAQMDHQYAYYTPWGDLGFNGKIDRVEIINRSLSDSEAAARYQDFVNTAGTGFTAYLLSAAKHGMPYIVAVFAVIIIVLAALYTYNRKRAGAAG